MLEKGDQVKINDLFHTIPKYGIDSDGRMLNYVGKTVPIKSSDPQSVRVDRYLFHMKDVTVVESKTPDWVFKISGMVSTASNPQHGRYYALTSNSKHISVSDCKQGGDSICNTFGGCFESFSPDRTKYQGTFHKKPEYLIWSFQRKGTTPKTRLNYLRGAQEVGLLDEDVNIERMSKHGHMRIRLRRDKGNGRVYRSTNIVYVSTCLGRYMLSSPDVIKISEYLYRKKGMNFLVAFCLAEFMCGSRNNQLISRNLFDYCPRNVRDNQTMAAQVARMLYKWQKQKEVEAVQGCFRWWRTLAKFCPSREELNKIAKLKYKDLLTYNPGREL